MTNRITVYSKPACVQCDMTYRVLNVSRAEYSSFDVTEDDEALATVKTLGYLSAPVVVVEDSDGNQLDHWSGFQPDRINKYV